MKKIQGTPLALSIHSVTCCFLSLLLLFLLLNTGGDADCSIHLNHKMQMLLNATYRIVSGDLYKASPALPKTAAKTQWQSSSSRNCVCRLMNSNRFHPAQGTGRGHQTDLGHELKLSKGREREREREKRRSRDHNSRSVRQTQTHCFRLINGSITDQSSDCL